LIYRQWMIDAHRRMKSGAITIAMGQAELDELKKAADKYAAAEAKAPASATDLMDWGNILRATGKFEDAIVKYRRAVDLDPSYADAAPNIVIAYIDNFERSTGPRDSGALLVALGSLADYLAWMSAGGPYGGLLDRVKQLLASVGHGQAFEECLSKTVAPPLADSKVDAWKHAAVFKFCIDAAIDGITELGIRAADVADASKESRPPYGLVSGDPLPVRDARGQRQPDQPFGVGFGGHLLLRRLTREGLGAHVRAHRTGIVEVDAHRGVRDFGGVGGGQHLEGRLAGGIGAPVGHGLVGDARGHEDRAAGVGAAQQRIERADQAPVGGDIDRHDLLEDLGIDVADRRERAQDGGVADQHVEAAIALVERCAQAIDAGPVGDVERHQRGGAADRLDLIVDLLEAA